MKNKKKICILIIVFTLFSINFNTSISASIKYEEEGIWTDNFTNSSGISKLKNCERNGNEITLEKTNQFEYNFSAQNQHKMWSSNWIFMISNNGRLFNLLNPIGEKEIKTDGHKKLNDDKAVNTDSNAGLLNLPIFHHFRFNTSFKRPDINKLEFSWHYGKNISHSNIKDIQFFLWNYSALIGGWEKEETVNISNIGSNEELNVNLQIENNNSVSKNGEIDLLIIATPDEINEKCTLSTDYVNLTITTDIYGYVKKGYIISEEISPTYLGNWESLLWEENKEKRDTNIKIQILKGDNKLINNTILPGNKEGFYKNNIDLTFLSSQKEENLESIKIKAVLESKNTIITPHLDRWSVLWQTDAGRFKDYFNTTFSFNTTFRLDKLEEAKIKQDGIHIKDNKNKSNVISYPINLPTDRWWNKFQASNNTEGNIEYSILDKNYNVLIDKIQNGDNVSKVIDTDVIRLAADITRENDSFDPVLKNWGITWKKNMPPYFINRSFKPNAEGWINTSTPVCKINIRDNNPGLDVKSARYRISYNSSNESRIKTSNWTKAECTGEKSSTSNETITVDISKSDMSKDIEILKSITISIKDIAGYETRFTKNLKEDTNAPISNIKNVDSFASANNHPVFINATAKDNSQGNSGVKNVSLLYKSSKDEEWKIYKTIPSPYMWEFETDNLSGELEFCTIATDKAGNVEKAPKKEELSFLFDTVKPYISNLKEEYRFNKLPNFSTTFKDEYKLNKVEYRLGFHGLNNWTILEEDISEKSATIDWNLTVEDWNKLNEKEVYHVFFRVTDWLGNTYEIKENKNASKLIKDLTACKPYLDLSDLKGINIGNDFTIYATAKEEEINKIQVFYRYSEDKEGGTDWKSMNKLFEEPFKWNFTAESGNGYYQFKTKTWDKSGNSGYSPVEEVNVKTIPMIPLIALISLIIVLLILTAVYIFKMKKNKEI